MSTRTLDSVRPGEELPPLDVPVTAAIIVGGAVASNDFTPVHHDRSAAQEQGLPDVFMNILTTNGYVGRYVTDWAGPDAQVKGVQLKLGGPNMPGDTLKIRGKVLEVDDGLAIVEVAGTNSWGNHVTARVKLALPGAA